MPEPRRRSALHLSLLAALALISQSIPASPPPIPTQHPLYLHASNFPDLDLPVLLPVAPAHACAGENLHALLAKWQRLLRLEEWQITIYCGLPAASSIDKEGLVRVFPRRRLAYIYVSPSGWSPLEEIVVHEVLHVALFDLKARKSEIRDEPEERLVEILTRRIYRSIEQ